MSLYIYGRNTCIAHLMGNDDVINIYIQEGLRNPRILELLENRKYEIVSRNRLQKLCGNENHQGIVCEIKSYDFLPLEDLLERADEEEYPLIVMLDGVCDPHNLGNIMRTCECVGCKSIIIPKHNSCDLNSVVAKVSTGAIEKVRVSSVTNLTSTINKLKALGYWIVGAEASGDTDYRNVDYKTKIVLVLGSEGFGVSKLVLKQCDFKVKLPMKGSINSLNVANAAAVLLYQVLNDRCPLRR